MRESIGNLLTLARLRWLGHVASMSDDRMPKRILFGWLPQNRALRMVLSCGGEIKLGKTLRAYPSMTLYGTGKLRIEVYGNKYVMQEWRIC